MSPLAYTTLAPKRSKTPRSGTKTRPARSIGGWSNVTVAPFTTTLTAWACAGAITKPPASAAVNIHAARRFAIIIILTPPKHNGCGGYVEYATVLCATAPVGEVDVMAI